MIAASLTAQAALINIDFNGGSYQNGVPNGPTQTGAAVVGSAGDVWNGFIDDAPSVRLGETLVDSTGASTSVTLDYSAGFNYDSMSWGTSPFVVAKSPVADLMVEFLGAGAGSTATLTFHGLAAGQYDIYLYSAPDSGSAQSRVTHFTANGVVASVGPNNNSFVLTEGVNYLHLIPTVAADGLLNISFDGGTGEGDLNGLQLRPAVVNTAPYFTAQPSPASATRFAHGTVTFTAAVDGTQPISLQWRHGSTDIPNATNATLTINDIKPADAGSYYLFATNLYGTKLSDAATLTLGSTPAHFVANFDFDCGGDMWPGTYVGTGVVGTGTHWNSIPGPNNWATGTYVSTTTLADDAVTDVGVSLTVVSAGNWAGNGKNILLDDFACAYTPAGQPFTFNGVPDGLYTLVLFGVNAPYADTRGTLFTVGGVTKATVNTLVDPVGFAEGDNYVVFNNLVVTNGIIQGIWAPNPVPYGTGLNGEGDFNGAQLQRVGDITAMVAPAISTQPQDKTVYEKMAVGFTVSGSGSPAPTYQWRKNGTDLTGATGTAYSLASAALTDAADYTVVLSNPMGSVTSSVAHLTVLTTPPTPAAGTFDAAVLAARPLAFWRLNDPAGTQFLYDSALGHIALNQGATLGVPGPQGAAYPGFPQTSTAAAFDGVAAAATTGVGLMNGLTNFTLMGWINPAGVNTERVGLFGQNDAVEFGFNDTDGVYLWLPTSLGGWVNPKSGPEGFAVGQWYFVALVANGKDVTIYINGMQRGQVAGVGAPTGFSGYGFNIGGGGIIDATGNFFNGQIADVAIFDRAFTGEAVNSLYAIAAATTAPSIVTQPASQNVLQGFPVKLSVVAAGTPLAYQWQSGPAAGPFTDLVDGPSISGARAATLTLANMTASQVASYRVIVSNSLASVTSDAAALTLQTLTVPWSVNFDFDCSPGGYVGTYTGLGAVGSGAYWNAIAGPSSWASGTYKSSGGLLDDGATDTGIALYLTTGGCWSYSPTGNQLLDDYATADANGKPFTFTGVPDGRYNLALYSVDGGWHDRGTIFTVNGLRQTNANASSIVFVEGDNYVMFRNLTVRGGTLTGTYAANPAVYGGNNNEGQFCGAQLQFLAPIVTLVATPAPGGQLKLEWTQGSLEQTTDLSNSSWAPVTGANSPYLATPPGPRVFYRVKVQ